MATSILDFCVITHDAGFRFVLILEDCSRPRKQNCKDMVTVLLHNQRRNGIVMWKAKWYKILDWERLCGSNNMLLVRVEEALVVKISSRGSASS